MSTDPSVRHLTQDSHCVRVFDTSPKSLSETQIAARSPKRTKENRLGQQQEVCYQCPTKKGAEMTDAQTIADHWGKGDVYSGILETMK
jgi:hypothetical protein